MTGRHNPEPHTAPSTDFFRWEDPGAGEFPYYRGSERLGLWGWALILLGVALGLTADLTNNAIMGALPHTKALQLTVGILIILAVPGLPLLGVWLAAGPRIRLLFRRLTGRNWALIVVLMVLTALWSAGMNKALGTLGQQSVADASVADGASGVAKNIGVFLELPFLIFGEALFVVLPFLAVLALFTEVFKIPRKPAVIGAALIAGLAFGVYHFKAYDWHWAQMLISIGLGQIIVLFGYLKTKNVLVTYLAHLLLDWVIVGLAIITGLSDKAVGG